MEYQAIFLSIPMIFPSSLDITSFIAYHSFAKDSFQLRIFQEFQRYLSPGRNLRHFQSGSGSGRQLVYTELWYLCSAVQCLVILHCFPTKNSVCVCQNFLFNFDECFVTVFSGNYSRVCCFLYNYALIDFLPLIYKHSFS